MRDQVWDRVGNLGNTAGKRRSVRQAEHLFFARFFLIHIHSWLTILA